MDFLKENPHPLVEDHYHIQELINVQTKRTAQRKAWQEKKREEDSFYKSIQDYKQIELLDFWCDLCGRDFTARAAKQVDSWGQLAYYKIKHRCGTWCLRRITDRVSDQYFHHSRKVAYDRGVNAKEMLQSFQSGFNLLYGKQNAGIK